MHLEVERGAPFCANPRCDLHVRLLDERVDGGGNWVTLPDGRIFGRGRFGAALLCDACGTLRGPVRLARAGVQELKRWRRAPVEDAQGAAQHAAEVREVRDALLARR